MDRKLIYLVFILLLVAGFLHAQVMQQIVVNSHYPITVTSPNVIQYAVGSCFTTSCTTANFSVGNLTNGDELVAIVNAVSGTTTTVAGCGLTWTTNGTTGSVNSQVQFVATAPITSTAACTGASRPTISGPSGVEVIFVFEVNSSSGTIDSTPAYNFSNTATNFAGPSITTTVDGDIILVFCYEATTTTYTLDSPFSTTYAANNGGFYLLDGYDQQASHGAINATYTYSGSSHQFVREAVAIKP